MKAKPTDLLLYTVVLLRESIIDCLEKTDKMSSIQLIANPLGDLVTFADTDKLNEDVYSELIAFLGWAYENGVFDNATYLNAKNLRHVLLDLASTVNLFERRILKVKDNQERRSIDLLPCIVGEECDHNKQKTLKSVKKELKMVKKSKKTSKKR